MLGASPMRLTSHPHLLMMSGLTPKASAVPAYEAAVTMPTAVVRLRAGTLRAVLRAGRQGRAGEEEGKGVKGQGGVRARGALPVALDAACSWAHACMHAPTRTHIGDRSPAIAGTPDACNSGQHRLAKRHTRSAHTKPRPRAALAAS